MERELTETEAAVEERAAEVLSHHGRLATVLRVVRAVQREQGQEQVGLAASGAAFWLIIAVFPTAIAAVSIFGLIVDPKDVAKDLEGLAKAGPTSFGSIITDQLQRVAAAGLNFADTAARIGLYPDAPKLPAVFGYEVSGGPPPR